MGGWEAHAPLLYNLPMRSMGIADKNDPPVYKSVAQSQQVPAGHAAWKIPFSSLALDGAKALPGTVILST